EDAQRLSVEHAVEKFQHLVAEICFERFDVFGFGGEHLAVAGGDLQFLQAVILAVEIVRHSAMAIDAFHEGDAGEIAIQTIGPLVIGALEDAGGAIILTADFEAAVGALVLEDVDLAFLAAHHNDGGFARMRALEIARIGDFGFKADIIPRAGEDVFHLARVNFGVGIDPIGHAVRAVEVPFAFVDGHARPVCFSTSSRRRSNASEAAIMGARCSLRSIRPSFFIMYLSGMGLVSKKIALEISNSAKWSSRALARSPASTAVCRAATRLGSRLPTAFIMPTAPMAIMGKHSSSSPTKILKSWPMVTRRSVTKARSVEACLTPTRLGHFALTAAKVATSIDTAARPGM